MAIATSDMMSGGVNSVAFAPDGILVCAAGRSVAAFDTRRADNPIIQTYGGRVWGVEDFADDEVNQISVSDGGGYSKGNPSKRPQWRIACCEDSGDIHVFNFPDKGGFGGVGTFDATTECSQLDQRSKDASEQAVTYSKLTGVHTNLCTSASWMPGCRGRTLVSGSMDATICVWNVRRSKPIADGGHITCGPADQGASTSGGSQLLNPPFVQCVDCSPYVCAAALGDGTVGLYDMAKFSSVGRLRGHSSATACVRFVPPSESSSKWEWLFSAGNDRNICLWNLSDGLSDMSSTAEGHQGDESDDWVSELAGASIGKKNSKSKRRQGKRKERIISAALKQVAHEDDEQMNDSDEVLVPPMKLDPALVGLPLRFEHEHKVNWLTHNLLITPMAYGYLSRTNLRLSQYTKDSHRP